MIEEYEKWEMRNENENENENENGNWKWGRRNEKWEMIIKL